jgi:hypothetical protein
MLRRTGLVVGALLILFHAWILGDQAWNGSLAEPALLGRWLAAAVVAVGLGALGRNGSRRQHGRHTVAAWLLVAMVHAPALAGKSPDSGDQPSPDSVIVLELLASAALGLVALSAAQRRTPVTLQRAGLIEIRRASNPAVAAGFAYGITARPPPHW